MKKGTIILITMLAAAAVAIVFGLYVMKQRINSPLPNQSPTATNPDQTNSQNQDQQQATNIDAGPTLASTVGWKTYTNDKHGFTVQYPSYLKAGAVSDNSVLGTFQVPVRGLHVGPLVLVALEDKGLAKDAKDYFTGIYNAALNPAPTQGTETQPVVCKIDKVTNSNVVSIQSVSCNGEGGPAKYAYITGKTYDVFIDGESKGYDSSNSGEFANPIDYVTVLSTFIFTKDVAAAVPPPADGTKPTPTPSIQAFSIAADDSSATPSIISVPMGTIVEITFNVASANVYQNGLDFRSSVVNSGTVLAGQSKTISFTANNSFDFTPYWPASQVAKNYKISVLVQ